MTDFDDFLGLRHLDLRRFHLVVFYGKSGSGKSTAIRFLLDHHFQGVAVRVIDEIAGVPELMRRRGELREPAIVAAHIRPFWFRLVCRGPMIAFRTDRDASKIVRYLGRLGIAASLPAVERYVRKFGATYTDVDLILERCPAPDFDRSLARFLKLHDIE